MEKSLRKYISEQTEEKLKLLINPHRFLHSLGTAHTCLWLAAKYNINTEKAVIAGFIHDCAKDLNKKQADYYIKKYKIKFDDISKRIPELQHSFIGPYVAREIFNVKDIEILDAIRYHSFGNVKMGNLAKVIFAADYTEVNREHIGSKKIRGKIKTKISLDGLVKCVLEDKVSFLLAEGKLIHTMSIEMWNNYCK